MISMLVTVFEEELLGLLLGEALPAAVELLDPSAAGVAAADVSTAGAGSGLLGAQDTTAHRVTTPSRTVPHRLFTAVSNH
ncbi:MAG: hypothetical protein Q4D89_06655 [Arachnia propionica]|uniref:hypothetical protein n=1 Tax=Arachnia propionica TaxID=1750 RepID=UPI002708474A|nr:hypothetical protein [Arachnia propionica]